jgi:cell wall-associated NlpC family hydrolase
MQRRRTVSSTLASFASGLAVFCTLCISPLAQADTVFRVPESAVGTRSEPVATDERRGLFSSVMNSTSSVASNVANRAGDLVMNALGLIGVRYRFGGNSPETGLDCSGFVRYVFKDTFGFLLPRRAEEMSRVGTTIDTSELRPGDLVFFNTMRRTFSHVGIYIGDNKFVHAPSSGGKIRVDDMRQSYWVSRYNGARRVDEAQRPDMSRGLDSMVETLHRLENGSVSARIGAR